MPTNADVVAGILESLVASIVLIPAALLVKWITNHPPTFVREPLQVEMTPAWPPPEDYPATAFISERISWLEHRASDYGDGEPRRGHEDDLASCCSRMLQTLAFLQTGDDVPFDGGDGNARLLTLEMKLGDSALHQTWKAWDNLARKYVAIRFLKQYSPYSTTAEAFFATARVANQIAEAGGDVPRCTLNFSTSSARLPCHYVREFIDGETLRAIKAAGIDARNLEETLALGVQELSEALSVAEHAGIVNISVTPDNIVVRKHGGWRVVDLDQAVDVRKPIVAATGMLSDFLYLAPETLMHVTPSASTHSFSLARLVLFIYWPHADIPSPYQMTTPELIDRVNCGVFLKRVLRKATCLHPLDRYEGARSFALAVQVAIRRGGSRPPLIASIVDERSKVWTILRHTFWGTTIAMLIVRPIFTMNYRQSNFGLIQLSNRFLVGAFHGVIGGLIWGTLIPGAFLFFWVSHLRLLKSAPWWAVTFCAVAGFLGGVLCAFGAVLITNAKTLHELGWLLSTDDRMGNSARLFQTIEVTHMFFAFPWTGTLTGIAAGLFLSQSMRILAEAKTDGLEPIPAKVHQKEPGTVFSAMSFVLSPSPRLLLLLIPMLSALGAKWLAGYGVPKSAEAVRAFGEGMVHMFGLIGLMVGFFFGTVTAPSKESRWTRFTAGIHKRLLSFSKSEREAECMAKVDA